MGLQWEQLQSAMPGGGIFGGGTWLGSPEPFRLSRAEARFLESLGHPLACFQRSCDDIYRRSAHGSAPPWIAAVLDAGKPDWLVAWQHDPATRAQQPRVIRPDLLLTNDGFALTELDSVPGGIGITALLSQIYDAAGYDILGTPDGMTAGFGSILPDGGDIIVSAESADYRPEMEWLAGRLGDGWACHAAETYRPGDRAIYRFFELFDWQSVPCARELADASKAGRIEVTSPFKAHLEEKLWLALFRTPSLAPLWRHALRGSHWERLAGIIPRGLLLDPAPLPPHAALPHLGVHSWDEVATFSQRERRLVLKISGFHETAWGSRGVHIGHDISSDEWRRILAHALESHRSQPWIIQEFREGRLVEHPVFDPQGNIRTMRGRARICPYYFTDVSGHTSLGGCLATIVPADKKKIHGMTDGILVPCTVA